MATLKTIKENPPSSYLTKLAVVESGNNPNAKAKTSSASGAYQFLESTWKGLTNKYKLGYSLDDRFDPTKSKKVADLLTKENENALRPVLGRELNDGERYLGHFLGTQGSKELLSTYLKNPNESIGNVVSGGALKANKSIFLNKDGSQKTVEDVYNWAGKKMSVKPTYVNTPSQDNNQTQETITPDIKYFDIPKETPTFTSVPDSVEEDKKETVDKDVAEVGQKTKEYNFLEELQKEDYSHLQPEQVAQQQIVPQVDFNQQFEQVSQFIDEPLAAQQGLTWQEKLANRPKKLTVAEIIAEGDARKAQQITQADNTKVSNYNDARLFNSNVRNKTDKEIAQERETKIQASVEAQKTPYTKENWRQQLASETVATGDKLRVSLEPNFFDDYLNPAVMIGSMASNLGQAPLQAEQSDSVMPYITAIGAPLAVGAMAGLGAKTTGQFTNNIVNPLAGTGDLVNSLGNKYLPNAYKYNPMRFKASEDMGYRMLGKEGYEDAIETRVLRAKPIPNQPSNGGISLARNTNRNPNTGKMQPSLDRPYFADGFIDERYAGDYMASVNKLENNLMSIPTHKGIAPSQAGDIPLENATLYKKDWLQGYKQVEIPKKPQNFNSEINWGKWNKEIPDNPQLMKEYDTIEQTTKANDTWMKNPDGSTFQGTPEQFIQQNSENFKKSFSEGFDKTYRGSWSQKSYRGRLNEDNTKGAIFAGDEESVKKSYAPEKIFKNASEKYRRGLHELYYPKSENSLLLDAQNSNWRSIDKKLLSENIQDISNKSRVSTDDIATYIEKNDINYAKIRNVDDAGLIKEEMIFNHKPNNYLKSVWGNNGMFDMNNPNIYKSIIPVAGASYIATQENKQQGGEFSENELAFLSEIAIKDNNGYWNKNNKGKVVEIEGNKITMKGVKEDIIGISKQTGEKKIMKPNKNYTFSNTKSVIEVPLFKNK